MLKRSRNAAPFGYAVKGCANGRMVALCSARRNDQLRLVAANQLSEFRFACLNCTLRSFGKWAARRARIAPQIQALFGQLLLNSIRERCRGVVVQVNVRRKAKRAFLLFRDALGPIHVRDKMIIQAPVRFVLDLALVCLAGGQKDADAAQ